MRKKFAIAGLSDNLLIALVPLVGTYLAYIFQWSYFRFYGIPPSLIELDIPKIVFSILAIVLAVVVFLMIISYVAQFTSSTNPIVKIIGRQLVVVIFLLPLIVAGFSVLTLLQTLTYGTIFLALGLTSYIPPRNELGEKLSYLKRLRKREDKDNSSSQDEPKSKGFRSIVEERIIAPTILIAFGSFYVAMLGFVSAGMASTHNVLKSQPDAIYVTKHQDYFVFARYDEKTNLLKKELLFLRGTTDKPIELVEVETGLLLPTSK